MLDSSNINILQVSLLGRNLIKEIFYQFNINILIKFGVSRNKIFEVAIMSIQINL